MGIFDLGIKDFLPSAPEIPIEEKASATSVADQSAYFNEINSYANEPLINNLDFMKQYKESVWIYRCINAIATSVAQLPIDVYSVKLKDGTSKMSRRMVNGLALKHGGFSHLDKALMRQGRKKVMGHLLTRMGVKVENINVVHDNELVRLLSSPNPNTTGVEFWEGAIQHLELRGNSFWELVGEKGGEKFEINAMNPPVEMYLVNPNRVQIIPDAEKYVKGYVYWATGRPVVLDRTSVIHLRYQDPENEYYGQGLIDSLIKTLLNMRYANEYNLSFFRNSSTVDGALTVEGTLPEVIRERIQKAWEGKYKGSQKSHKIAILEGGVKYDQIGITQREADFIQNLNMKRDEIISASGCYPVIVGLPTANYATARIEERLFWQNTIVPKIKRIDAALNAKLAPSFGSNLFIERNFEDIEALRADRSDEYVKYVGAGIMSQNEARGKLGLPLVKGGDALYISPMLIPSTTVEEVPESEIEVELQEEEGDTTEDG